MLELERDQLHIVFETSVEPDQPAHPCSLSCIYIFSLFDIIRFQETSVQTLYIHLDT